ncbi:MATE family efflux transporter [Methylovirgula sp. 4M-Z18]|uniref:MATE family efflux transporter n=1 Tax=Methylovirgula sp. 4M-Z18 TaxID=2293567 RepID=UPI000E2F9B26|nr:MATE family efflux transporter [Methylovirgula sp. 4M-Z18]RFB80617.1 MATE family efflux transporter [Methylovirgula sp. 4M-Z18]
MSAAPNVLRAEISHARVIRIALPMTLAHMTTPLLGLADAAVIGRLGEASLLGAIATGAVIFDFCFWAFGFLRMGTAGFVAQALGAGDAAGQRLTVLRALVLALVFGLALILLQKPIANISFALIDASPAVSAAARAYFDIRIWSAPVVFVNYVVLGALIGRARTDIALVVQVAINLVNIVLNVWLVYGLSLGIQGSAFGTLLAESAGALAGLTILAKLGNTFAAIPWADVLNWPAMRRMLAVNRDIMLRTAALIFSFAFFTRQGAQGGDTILAANAVLMNLFLITAHFLDGFATAAEQMCGQSLGARDESGFRRAVRLTSLWCLTFSMGASVLAFVLGGAFIDFVSTNPEVRHVARQYLYLAALTPVAGAMAFEFDGVFVGATWTRDMRNLMLLALGLYLFVFWVAQPFGNTGLWLALLTFLAARGVLQGWRYPALVAAQFQPRPALGPVNTYG